MVDAILKLKAGISANVALPALAQFALDTFGEGGFPEAEKQEDFCGHIQTPVQGGYFRVRIGDAYGQALEYIEANGGNPYAELVRVEWAMDENGEPVTYQPIQWDEQVEIEGKMVTITRTLGGF